MFFSRVKFHLNYESSKTSNILLFKLISIFTALESSGVPSSNEVKNFPSMPTKDCPPLLLCEENEEEIIFLFYISISKEGENKQ